MKLPDPIDMLANDHGIDLLESGFDLDPNPGNDPDHLVAAIYRPVRGHAGDFGIDLGRQCRGPICTAAQRNQLNNKGSITESQ